jgi:hypothetical protein
MQKIGNILEDKKKILFLKLKLGEHIIILQNLVTWYKIKVEYDDINHLLTIIGFSIYKSYYLSIQRREICDIINILVRETKCILFHEANDRIRKILKKFYKYYR